MASENEPAVIVTKMYDLTLWLLPKVERLPRSYRFTVGDRMTVTGLELLTTLVEAAYARNKAPLLDAASRKINALRYLFRLAKDLKLLELHSYAFAAERLDEVGRMAGGWQKSLDKRA